MSIADHIAIFLHGSLDQARPSKAKPGKIEYYAQFAFPPAAADALIGACKSVAPNNSIEGLQLAPKLHSSLTADKQFAGVPMDWYIVRMSSGQDYPPTLFGLDGTKLAALPINSGRIREDFFSGQRVRVDTYPFAYPPKNGGRPGVSFNLTGVMAVGGGERRPGGNGPSESSESVFAKYRSESAPAQQAAQSNGAGDTGNPFQQGGASSNPFA